MRLTILGGGGFRVPLIHRALLADAATGDPVISELVLHDSDRGRLAAIESVLAGQRQSWGHHHGRQPDLRVRLCSDLDTALSGAAVVFCAIRVGGTRGRVLDETVALDLEVLGQETVGAGGISYGLRTLPVAEQIAERIATRAPTSWVINFTNPAGMVTEAMTRALGQRVIGICDSPVGLARRACRALGTDPGRVRSDYAGLNHLGWLRGLWDADHDLLPELLDDPEALASFEEGHLFGVDWLRALGAIPNEYLYYYYRAREARAAVERSRTEGAGTRGQQLVGQQAHFYRSPHPTPEEALAAWERTRREREETYMSDSRGAAGDLGRAEADLDGGGYDRVALAVMRAILRDEPSRWILNVRNRGALAGLDADAVVEVPCIVDAAGARPEPLAPLSHHQLGLVHAVKGTERDTIAAVRTGSRSLALRALGTHPLVDSIHVARRLLDGYQHAFPQLVDVLSRP
ncbi:6-phospho-beta-glucosidase [Lipingzhangella sp. LS1_29]|uniref:6-phospho-beta-glucosidase n=1 Tax=Lipingzhangella rawalii TaxID=2055835 RepID=A0ABU2H4G8_9ACTN|nr:6-phospho-beta-glucosidase [Lipingzhangella rawalii]MDS1269754.1 6-phospho-beta-glucosidase [Lipingzhangella rawalii]